jgi:hypothetical protein
MRDRKLKSLPPYPPHHQNSSIAHLIPDSISEKRAWAGAFVCLFSAIAITVYYWSPLIDARWGVMDDHAVVFAIGNRQRIPLSEVTSQCLWSFSHLPPADLRLRPSYLCLRALEMNVWGKNVSLWYSFRIAIAVVFATVLALVLLRIANPILVFGFLVYELSRPYWSGIFPHLGVGEAYTALGISLCAAALLVGKSSHLTTTACATIAVGVIIAGGSKESFLFLGILPLWLLFSHYTITTVGKMLLISAVLYISWIGVTIGYATFSAGEDFYANPVSTVRITDLALRFLTRNDVWPWLLAIAIFPLVVTSLEKTNWIGGEERRRMMILIAAAAILMLVFMSQYIFYSGTFESQGRFSFPAVLCRDAVFFLSAILLFRWLEATQGKLPARYVSLAITAVMIFLASDVLTLNRSRAQEKVEDTKAFTAKLNAGIQFLQSHPSAVLIINSHSVADYEPVRSILHYVRVAGAPNRVALKINDYSSESLGSNALLARLAKILEERQTRGGWEGLVPLDSVLENDECYSFGLSGPPKHGCVGENLWP